VVLPCRRDGGPAGECRRPWVPRPACCRARADFPPAAASLLNGVLAGQRANIPRICLRRTFHVPRLAPPVVVASWLATVCEASPGGRVSMRCRRLARVGPVPGQSLDHRECPGARRDQVPEVKARMGQEPHERADPRRTTRLDPCCSIQVRACRLRGYAARCRPSAVCLSGQYGCCGRRG
jgi:hypothetical protein